MERNLKEALKHRRSYYALSNQSPIPDEQIEEIVRFTVAHTPSAFNSQSSRLVLLLGEQHRKFWNLVKETLKKIISEAAFEATEMKINKSFLAGYGTILFYEDQTVVESLQKAFPLYQDKFPEWSEHTSAMHQLSVWALLEDAGFGASLQHYNPLIDRAVQAEWKLPEHWRLIAQMPFGTPLIVPGKKDNRPLEDRMRIFK
ncbi:nitroreductase family protein [uncultured Odoribacter sp.]|uniref:nitroreductase family protein n=1 Tax=uncultured Odoribacter sp. TaxID=876416 RepID=UPI00260B6EF5|nr:nitroreductase family protein [uncultured Odoribacter sp.]